MKTDDRGPEYQPLSSLASLVICAGSCPTSRAARTRLAEVRKRIAAAAEAAGRKPDDVRLVAVSKTFEAPDIIPVIEAGQRRFGENRVQEAMRKWPDLQGTVWRSRTASDRPCPDQQGGRCGRLLRCHPERRPAEACRRFLPDEMEKQKRRPALYRTGQYRG